MNLMVTFDLEEYEKAGEEGFDIGFRGGRVVRDLLNREKVTATFFVTASFYERVPDFVKELSYDHEIAFHGLNHRDDYQSLSDDVAFQKLMEGKNKMEKGLNLTIKGFRAPRMRPPSYAVLKKAQFLYSSSLHPTYVPGRYNHFTAPRSPSVHEGVAEIPVSVAPLVRLPVSWVWFRQLGVTYAKVVTLLLTDYVCIYFHPWEFVSLKGYGGVVHTRNTGERMERALGKFLSWASPRMKAVRMEEFAEKVLKR